MPAALTQYRADQTIVRQEFASSIETGQASAANNFAFQVQPVDSQDSRVALIQYVDAATIRPYWNKVLSSLAKVKFVSPTLNTNVGLKMRLIYRNDLPPTLGNAEPITGWDVNGDPEFDPSWGEILPLNDPTYTLENGSDFVDLSFDQFQMPPAENATMYLGVVIYTTEPFVSTPGSKDELIFDSVSLVNNDFAIASPPKTFDQVLQECQFYYEKSYRINDLPGSINTANTVIRFMTARSQSGYASAFDLQWKTVKRANPNLTVYRNDATQNQVIANIFRNGTGAIIASGGAPQFLNNTSPADNTGYWAQIYLTANGAGFQPKLRTIPPATTPTNPGPIVATSQSAADNLNVFIEFQYTADARLGN